MPLAKRGISFTSYLRYVVGGKANAPVFVTHASFLGRTLRKCLLEIVCNIMWIFGEYPAAVFEC